MWNANPIVSYINMRYNVKWIIALALAIAYKGMTRQIDFSKKVIANGNSLGAISRQKRDKSEHNLSECVLRDIPFLMDCPARGPSTLAKVFR